MSSITTYIPFIHDQYCVYHTTYSGDKLPSNYIGSTSINRINNENYHGSVCSKDYKTIWKSELKEHPELFKTEIVSYHDTRPDALYKEYQIQKIFNVIKNPLFINMAMAATNGHFGASLKGSDNPAYSRKGKSRVEIFGNEVAEKMSNILSICSKGSKNPRARKYKIVSPDGETYYVHGNLQKFCDEHNIGFAILWETASKKTEIVPPINYKMTHFKLSEHKIRRENSINWRITYID